ncbi:hypothetical protein, partial [Neisseria sp. P0018.S002]
MKPDSLNEKNEFLVIGLVGAVGSRLKPLSNILNSILIDEFNYKVEEIHISKEFLERNKEIYENQFDRYKTLMDH